MDPSPDFLCRPWFALSLLSFIVFSSTISVWAFFRRLQQDHLQPPLRREHLGMWLRESLSPCEHLLVRWAVHPNVLTYAQLGVSALAGVAYGIGYVFVAGWLILCGGILDILDGGVARSSGRANRRGAFIDSVIDRYAEFLYYLGLAVFFRGSWVLWVVFFSFLGSMMVSYTRARAEGLGVECRVGMMQRAERYILLGGGSLLSTITNHLSCLVSPLPVHSVLIVVLVAIAILANVTALHRVLFVTDTLSPRVGIPEARKRTAEKSH